MQKRRGKEGIKVRKGSLAWEAFKASKAKLWLGQIISNIIAPGWIRVYQKSLLPLPLPIRTSAGLAEAGIWGKTLQKIEPSFLRDRLIARSTAEIWAAVKREGWRATRASEPLTKDWVVLKEEDTLPLCAFANLECLGLRSIIMEMVF